MLHQLLRAFETDVLHALDGSLGRSRLPGRAELADFADWRAARRARPDGLRSRAVTVDSLPADGATARTVTVQLVDLEGIALTHVDIGGGLGIRYRDESPPAVADYARALVERLGNRTVRLLLEPGRAITGHAGLLLTRVEYLKHGRERNFAVVDAAMNDLLRPALYDAWHEVRAVRAAEGGKTYDIVGPVCESGDFLARGRTLALREGDLLAVMAAGAYGMSMSSNYNTRPRAAEVMVDGGEAHLIREREVVSDLMAREKILP